MVAAAPTPTTAEMPLPNVPLIHRPGAVVAPATLPRPPLKVRKRLLVVGDQHAQIARLVKRLRLG